MLTYKFYRADTKVLVQGSTYSEARRMFYRRKGFWPDETWEVTVSKPVPPIEVAA